MRVYNPVVMILPALIAATTMLPTDEMKPTYFIFLVTGKNPPKASQEDIQKYQMAHIDNFKRLNGEKKLMTAGPCADPEKSKRGIVVLAVKSEKEIAECFKPDPYVSMGFMEVKAAKIEVLFGGINTNDIDPKGIEENRIVVFSAGAHDDIAATLPAARLDHIRNEGVKAGLAFYATLKGTSDWKAVALFKGKDDEKINAWIKSDPAVQNGYLKAVSFPQWLGKGVLK